MGDRTLEHRIRRRTAGVGFDVFAVEPTSAQVVWSRLTRGPADMLLDGRSIRTIGPDEHDATSNDTGPGPGAVMLDGLEPDHLHTVTIRTGDGEVSREFRTTAPPPGQELFRFATISDLHLGRGDKEYKGPMASRATPEPRTGNTAKDWESDRQFRCARAAIDEALAWGAELLVVKGDLCDETVDWIWDQAAALLGDLPIPVVILPGNHDTGALRHFEPEVGASTRGLSLTRGVDHLDVPGLRIILVDSTTPGNGWGAVARHAEEVATVAGDADTAVFVATHHHPQRITVPLFWPHGIPGPDANEFARGIVAANPAVMASSGHTHRCRRRDVQGMPWTEVAATNHFPGVWGGYVVHEGGLRQVVSRIAEPQPLQWLEHTRHMLGGAWALWSTGTLSDRCFSLTW